MGGERHVKGNTQWRGLNALTLTLFTVEDIPFEPKRRNASIFKNVTCHMAYHNQQVFMMLFSFSVTLYKAFNTLLIKNNSPTIVVAKCMMREEWMCFILQQ